MSGVDHLELALLGFECPGCHRKVDLEVKSTRYYTNHLLEHLLEELGNAVGLLADLEDRL